MKIARKLGKQVPDDVQVIGFTDGVLSRHATPSLTTMKQHGQKIGETAAALLIGRIEDDDFEENYQTLVIETELVERESTR